MNVLETDFLILGGGVGGIVAANRLRKLAPSKSVLVVDRAARQNFQPSFLWVATGARRKDAIGRSLRGLVKKGIRFVESDVTSVDLPARAATLANGDRVTAREALVVALGAELRPDLVPGLHEAGLNLYTLEGSTKIDRELAQFQGGRIVVLTAEPIYRCPAAPYEAALLIDYRLRKRGVRDRTTLSVYAAESDPMITAGPPAVTAVRGMLGERAIPYHPEHKVTKVDAADKVLHFANGESTQYDLLIYVPPHRLPRALEGAGISGPTGWLTVDRHTFATAVPGVYAIGDNTSVPLAMGKPLPKAGVFAHRQAEVVAHNLAFPQKPIRFEGAGSCFIETGYHRAAMGSGNFYAEPTPQVALRQPSYWWHLGKVLYEKNWLRRWY